MHQQRNRVGGLIAACILAVTGQKVQAEVGTDPVIVPLAQPTVTISAPASETSSLSHSNVTVSVAGTLHEAVGQLVWTNRLTVSGGALDASENWSVPEITLSEGVNEITVTATNAAGNAAAATVKVIRQAPPAVGALRVAVFSDPHYFAPELLLADGPAFQTYLAQDRKLIAESAAITKAVVDQLIARNPSVVFVTGDLTKDGERDSHIAFSNELARLEAAGAQVLVIPGNHDIDNPHAVSYDSAATLPVPSVSPAEFKTIYGPFGYDLASATDPDSVGYTVPLTPALTAVCMDSTQYGNRTHGAFTNGARLAWITNQLVTARAAGAQAIGLMHHGLLEHYPGQKQLFSEYVLDGYETVAPLFASLGLKAVFTGHFHANDIVQAEFDGHTLTDIETGSTVTYPCPFRVLEFAGDGTLAITTDTVKAIDYDLGAAPDFPTYASDYLWDGMLILSSYMLQLPPFGLPAAMADALSPAVTEAMLAHYAGDEPGLDGASPQTQAIIAGLLAGDPSAQQLGLAIAAILLDTAPADNDITLVLTPPALTIASPTEGDAFPVESASATVTLAPTLCVGEFHYANTTMGVTLTTGATTANLPLQPGWNQLVVRGTNSLGLLASATVTVSRASLSSRQLTMGLSAAVSVPNAEIVAYDAGLKRAFVTCQNQGLRIVDLSLPFAPQVIGSALEGEWVNSVAIKNGLVAAAVENAMPSNRGEVVFMDTTGWILKRVTVGIQPDMVTFTPDGNKVLTADEAETGDHADYGAGSVSVIDLADGVESATVTTLGFEAFDSQTAALREAGVRIFPGCQPSLDFEPEYIAVAPDGQTAMVTLQENNALAKIDLNTLSITGILPLGLKDHSLPGHGLDASDKDGPSIAITNWPVFGMYMPDAIASFQIAGQTYYVTANEGDTRTEAQRIGELTLDPVAFPDAATLKLSSKLGRLSASTIDGDTGQDGDFDRLLVYGGRSFSILDATGALVHDSGDTLERLTAALTPALFNANDGVTSKFDQRSDDKGCEPEGVEIATVGNSTYAFVALERAGGGIMGFDVTAPSEPVFLQYARRDGDVGPEGLKFVPAADSPNGKALLLVAHETSQTLTVYEVETGGYLHVLSTDATVSSSAQTYTVSGCSGALEAQVTWFNEQTGTSGTATAVDGIWSASVPLVYGLNVLVFSGANGLGLSFTDTVTVTRAAPAPANGTDLLPGWDTSAAGTVHVAWTTNDWYQFQGGDVCLPGAFLFRDWLGGTEVPGDGEPEATTLGASHFRYDADDGARSIVVEGDADFSVRIPCFDSPVLGAPRTHEVWVRLSYWDAPGNPAWVQGWSLSVTPDSGSATAPVLMGRVYGADGVLTEAYACTVTGDTSDLSIRFSADPALTTLNPAYVTDVTVDAKLTTPPLRISGPAEGGTVPSTTESATVAVVADGLVGTLLFRNENTGEIIVVPVNRARATLDLIYGANVISVTGTDSEGHAVTASVTVTRAAPATSSGDAVHPDWDYTVATGAVHVAWTADDWYQFQSGDVCLPGDFLFRDPFGGAIAPGAGDPDAITWWGTTHFRYDAQDGSRCAVVEEDDDLSFWVPCYNSAVTGVAPVFQNAWIQLTYWDAPGNPKWVQNWILTPYAVGTGASVSSPELVGRSRGADGLITEAYRMTISGDATGFFIDVAADPALSALNPAFISAVAIDTWAPTQPLIDSPAEGTSVGASSDSVTLTFRSQVFAGTVTGANAALGTQVTGPAGAGRLTVPLAYGLNVLTLSGTNAAGHAISTTVTVTREAPMPAQGTNLLPGWDAVSGVGTAQAVWTTNDWYQFQGGDTCLPGTFLFRDPFGGAVEPGDGEPVAATSGSSHFRYDARDGSRCVVVAGNADFSVRMPCYDMPALGAPRTHDVWVRVSYWDAPGNPGWVQGWVLSVTPDSGSATTPALMGRVHGADGVITEAYAFTVTGETSDFGLVLAAAPALSALNPAYVSEVAVATRVTTPLLITGPSDGSTVSSSTELLTVDVATNGLVGALTVRNQITGAAHTVQAGAGSLQVGLVFGLNVITVTGVDSQGRPVTATVTVTRQAPTPVGGTAVLPDWDYAVANGAAHVAWTTNDWYQFQSGGTCLPGAFRFRDPFGGAAEPGDGEPVALSSGATHFRYDAADGARCIVVEEDADLSVWIPLYDMPALGAPRTHEVWVRVSYWDAPGNPEWVQNWSLGATPDCGSATTPELRGRVHGADGLITEAYAFTVMGDASAFALGFSADPALSALNAAYVSEVTVDTRVSAPLLIASPAEGDTVACSTEYATVAVAADGLVGLLTFRNESTGQVVTVPASRGRAMIALGYGLNVITVTGTDSQGCTVSATVTITRDAPPPANGADVAPAWDPTVATGAVHVAWTTNDWYQFQSGDTCLPGTFLYRDPFGGMREPGAGAPDALTQGATHFRYDAQDGTRCAVVEQNWDLSLWVPCYGSSVAGVPMNQRVWLRVSYWDAPGNPQWIQDWDIAPYAPGASVSTPVLMGRTHGADGLITEAYAFTVTGDASGFFVDLAAAPALSDLAPAFVSDVRIDVLAEPGVLTHRILTTVEGDGTVSVGSILVAHGASTNIVLTAAEWHRIHALTTNGAEVAAAADSACYTQHWTSVTADYNNHVVFGHRSDEQNPDGVPTVWLASFGRDERAPVMTTGLSLSDKHLLDLDPYSEATVVFDIDNIEVKAGVAEVHVRLLVDGKRQPTINGTLVIEGRPTLISEWTEVDSTQLTGDVFDGAGRRLYTVPVDTNCFFRAVIR